MAGQNRAERAQMAHFWDSVADDAKIRSQAIRQELTAEASAEFQRDGIAPTWRIPGFGSVPLNLTSDTVEVTDPDAYAKFVAERWPDEVESVLRVRKAFDGRLRASAVKRGDPPTTADGEVIPGLVFRPGGQPKGIQIRPDDQAKELAAHTAHAFLDSLLRSDGGEQS